MSVLPLNYTDVVLDTSIIVKWFRQGEVLANRALLLRDAYLVGQIAISVPTLLAYELTNVLRYKNDLTTEQVQEAVQSLFDMGLAWVAPSDALICRAVEIARTYETTVYDAAFIALAETSKAGFITADEQLVNRLGGLAFVYSLNDIIDHDS
jgi:predicted nucleic acid-binding protein